MSFCPHCQLPVASSARFCEHCGKALSAAKTQPPPLPPSVAQRSVPPPLPRAILYPALYYLRGSLGLGVFLLLLVIWIPMSDLDPMNLGAPIWFVSLFLCLTAFVTYFVLRRHYSTLFDLVEGKTALAYWPIPAERWANYTAVQHEADKARVKIIWITIFAFSVVISVLLMLLTGFDEGSQITALFMLGFNVFLLFVAWLAVFTAHQRRLRTKTAAVYVLPQGLWMAGELHTWRGTGGFLEVVDIDPEEPDFLKFIYYVPERTGLRLVEVRVPLPEKPQDLDLPALQEALKTAIKLPKKGRKSKNKPN